MDSFLTVINVIVLIAFIIMLNVMAKRHISFPKRVFTALAIGIILGIAMHLIYGVDSKVIKTTSDWFSIVGDGYVALLQMIVMPLILFLSFLHSVKYKLGTNLLKSVVISSCFNWDCSYSCLGWYWICVTLRFRCIFH